VIGRVLRNRDTGTPQVGKYSDADPSLFLDIFPKIAIFKSQGVCRDRFIYWYSAIPSNHN